ncbi:MAG: aspartate carbamoyltransferase [Janthinobacterium lividum]
MTEQLHHLISASQFSPANLEELFVSADRMQSDDKARRLFPVLQGRILATLFYEPSTRTRLSFEAAMQKLGGSVLSVENARDSSSAVKGESIADTIRVVSGYADAIAIRHFEEGTAAAAAASSPVPVINAGDGVGEHPTQALADGYTIHRELGRLDHLRVTLVGDLLYGRTIHSLLPLLAMYPGQEIVLVSPPSLRLPARYAEALRKQGVVLRETEALDSAVEGADVVYVTRVQGERFASSQEYDAVKDAFVLNINTADRLKPGAVIMHALPRLNEIAPEVDLHPRAAYFRQARNGLYVRMALLAAMVA